MILEDLVVRYFLENGIDNIQVWIEDDYMHIVINYKKYKVNCKVGLGEFFNEIEEILNENK